MEPKRVSVDAAGHTHAAPRTCAAPPPPRLYQIDDETPGSYTSSIHIDSHKVYIRELNRSEFLAYCETSRQIAAEMRKVQEASLQAGAGESALEVASEAISGRQAAQYAELVSRHVVAWELPQGDGVLPCTPETKGRLPVSVQFEMALRILQKSRLGRDETDF